MFTGGSLAHFLARFLALFLVFGPVLVLAPVLQFDTAWQVEQFKRFDPAPKPLRKQLMQNSRSEESGIRRIAKLRRVHVIQRCPRKPRTS
jgi:hypothetical protein